MAISCRHFKLLPNGVPTMTKPINYFRTHEFQTNLKVGFTNALSASLLAGFTNGFRLEVLFPVFVGTIGSQFMLAHEQIKRSPNIYTDNGLPERDLNEALLYSAKQEAIAQARDLVLGKGKESFDERVSEVAQQITPRLIAELAPKPQRSLVNSILNRIKF